MTPSALIGATMPRLRIARVVLPVIALVAASALRSEPVQAQESPPPAAWLVASVRTAAPGDAVTFTVFGFGGGTTVTVTLMSPGSVALGTTTADYDGIGVLTARVPMSTHVGDHSVSANGADPDGNALTVSTPLEVAVRVAEFEIARAGTRSVAADAIGPASIITIFGGSLLVVAVRKRRGRKVAT